MEFLIEFLTKDYCLKVYHCTPYMKEDLSRGNGEKIFWQFKIVRRYRIKIILKLLQKDVNKPRGNICKVIWYLVCLSQDEVLTHRKIG